MNEYVAKIKVVMEDSYATVLLYRINKKTEDVCCFCRMSLCFQDLATVWNTLRTDYPFSEMKLLIEDEATKKALQDIDLR